MVHISCWLPLLAIVVLKFLVLLRMVYCRFVQGAGRDPEHYNKVYKLLDPSLVAKELSVYEQQAMRNLANQGEFPPLFVYLCILTSLYPQSPSLYFFIGSWTFVALRYTHSWVHCFSNKIIYRRRLFISSSVILAMLYIELLWKVIYFLSKN